MYAKGTDVYNEDGAVNWSAFEGAGLNFAFCKATQSTHEIDPRLSANMDGMKTHGVIRGCYHFFVCGVPGDQQAAHFLNTVYDAGYDPSFDLPLVVDLEDREGAAAVGQKALRAGVEAFLKVVEARIGRKAMIYADADFLVNVLGSGWEGHPLWLARYADTIELPQGWHDWRFWQYAEHGSAAGIRNSGGVDRDYFNGSVDDLKAWIASSK